jgi:hypothetical protein
VVVSVVVLRVIVVVVVVVMVFVVGGLGVIGGESSRYFSRLCNLLFGSLMLFAGGGTRGYVGGWWIVLIQAS